jgi:anti-sigma regulatory factor (Ser/Thr protein kinase)
MTGDQCSKLSLAVTEVVSNAVRHSGSSEEIRLILTAKDGYLCVRVIDGGNGMVPMPGAMTSEPGAGFGLFIVEQLTRRWGVTREEGKTRVWFEIDYAGGDARVTAPDAPCDPV